MEKPTETRRLRHLSLEINLREVGLQPYPVAFTREESPPVTSMLEEGVWYTHPERHEFVIVWAKDEAAIAEVLTYHYGQAGTAFNCLGPFLMRNLPVFRLTVLPSMTMTSMVGPSVPHEPVFCGYVLLDCPLQSPGKVLADPHMTVVPQTHASFLEGLALYESRPDKAYSLTDCISMQTMRREGLTDVLTNDHHCRQEGFRILFP